MQHTIILDPNCSTNAILTNLVILIRKNARTQTIVEDRIMIILFIAAVATTAAMTQIVLKGDVGGGGVRLGYVDIVLGPVAVLVVDALGLAGVDVCVVPVGEGGVRRDGVVGVVFVADGGEAFVVIFAGSVVEGEDLNGQ